MSDTQATPETEAIADIVETPIVETPVVATPAAATPAPRGDRGDRKGPPRRDGGRG